MKEEQNSFYKYALFYRHLHPENISCTQNTKDRLSEFEKQSIIAKYTNKEEKKQEE